MNDEFLRQKEAGVLCALRTCLEILGKILKTSEQSVSGSRLQSGIFSIRNGTSNFCIISDTQRNKIKIEKREIAKNVEECNA
jgi:hypothetical protein